MHEDIQDRETLLIALGDSWTWGDSICNIDTATVEQYDHPDRVKYIYGAQLAKMLNSDFVNVGHCGGSNNDMLKRLVPLLSHNHAKYKKIYVIITLTEICRDLYHNKGKGIDRFFYNENIQPFAYFPLPDSINKNFYEFLKMYERNMFLRFKYVIEQYKEVKFLIGRNFTYSFGENVDLIKDHHLNKNWIDCLNEHQANINIYPKDIRCLTQISINSIDSYFKDLGVFDHIIGDLILELAKGRSAIDWFMSSPLNHKKASRHPTIEGHEIWAKYLYENFTKENS